MGRQALAKALPLPAYGVIRGVWRRARLLLPASWLSSRYPGIPGPVHDEDYMLAGPDEASVRHYVETGIQPVEAVGRALEAAGSDWSNVRRLLDYGSGYGRVLRWVRERHPHVEVTAADVNRQAISFCASELGAVGLPVPTDVGRLSLPHDTFDAIWVGSVLTHFSEQECREVVSKLAAALTPGGVLIFTTHGELLPERIEEYGPPVAAARTDIERVLVEGGIYYVPPARNTYAQTFHASASVEALIAGASPPLSLLSHSPRGWDDHHDVWSCRRAR